MDEDPTAEAMTVVAEELIRAYRQTDYSAVERALTAEIIRSVEALHPALGPSSSHSLRIGRGPFSDLRYYRELLLGWSRQPE